MPESAVRTSHLTKTFGDVVAVEDASFAVERGQVLALLGPSGCGKTTTLRLIAGFERPDEGRIEVGGRVVADSGTFLPPESRRVGMVFQDYALFPHLDVAGNVGYGLARSRERETRIGEMLELVGLSDVARRMPHELSGGQQQRVALARALAPQPDVLLLDEPFSNLDATLRARVRAEVREILKSADATAIFVTHDREEALSLADLVAVLWRGRVVQIESPDRLYERPASLDVANFIGDADVLPGEADGERVACELGTLVGATPAHGQVRVVIRPEAVRLRSDPVGPGLVTGREFYVHDQLVTVRLPSGRSLRARLGPREAFAPGDRVSVDVEGEVVVFPAELATATRTEDGG